MIYLYNLIWHNSKNPLILFIKYKTLQDETAKISAEIKNLILNKKSFCFKLRKWNNGN